MHSRPLHAALAAFVEEAAAQLSADTAAGAEVPFEIVAQPSRLHRTPLYCYRPLTGEFIREREATLSELESYAPALTLMSSVEGLERYLLTRGAAQVPADVTAQAELALRGLLDDVFSEQTDFELRPERLRAALEGLERSAVDGIDHTVVVVGVRGLALASPEVALTTGLALMQPDALAGAPEEALASVDGRAHALAVLKLEEVTAPSALVGARELLGDLLRALRLFGDGRVTLDSLAWTRTGAGPWRALALGPGGRARGVFVVAVEQEDELRAFCNLVSRRAPHGNELAWALSRWEMGCDRRSDHEALSDHLLGLRALLEPEGPGSGMLPGRLAALCATEERRASLTERVARAAALEHAVITGAVEEQPGDDALVHVLSDHLRALLRDVVCGHLDPDLVALADGILAPEGETTDIEPVEQTSELDRDVMRARALADARLFFPE